MDAGMKPSMHGGPSHSYVQPSGSTGDVLSTGPGPRAEDTVTIIMVLANMREETPNTASRFDGVKGGRFSILCSEPKWECCSAAQYSAEAERTEGTDHARGHCQDDGEGRVCFLRRMSRLISFGYVM